MLFFMEHFAMQIYFCIATNDIQQLDKQNIKDFLLLCTDKQEQSVQSCARLQSVVCSGSHSFAQILIRTLFKPHHLKNIRTNSCSSIQQN